MYLLLFIAERSGVDGNVGFTLVKIAGGTLSLRFIQGLHISQVYEILFSPSPQNANGAFSLSFSLKNQAFNMLASSLAQEPRLDWYFRPF